MPYSCNYNRWRCDITSPIDNDVVLWSGVGPTAQSIVDLYDEQVGNGYLNISKLVRKSTKKSKNPLIRLYRINAKLVNAPDKPVSPITDSESD